MGGPDIVIDRLAGLFGQLKSHWPSGLPLPDCRPIQCVSTRRDILDFHCDDIATTVAELTAKGVSFHGEPEDRGWGVVTTMVLPGGVDVMLYEPRHPTAHGRP